MSTLSTTGLPKREFWKDKEFEDKNRNRFDSIYLTYCVGLTKIEVITDRGLQFKGHDIHLHFDDNSVWVIDEKARWKDWEDILIEYLSNKETGRRGWIYSNESDFIVFLLPNKGCYFLKTPQLKSWVEDKSSGFWQLPDIESKNTSSWGDYTTISKAVPLDLLSQLDLIYRWIK